MFSKFILSVLSEIVNAGEITPALEIGQQVNVNGKLATIESIGLSPYWNEEKQGITRIAVWGFDAVLGMWSDYLLPEELNFDLSSLNGEG